MLRARGGIVCSRGVDQLAQPLALAEQRERLGQTQARFTEQITVNGQPFAQRDRPLETLARLLGSTRFASSSSRPSLISERAVSGC